MHKNPTSAASMNLQTIGDYLGYYLGSLQKAELGIQKDICICEACTSEVRGVYLRGTRRVPQR